MDNKGNPVQKKADERRLVKGTQAKNRRKSVTRSSRETDLVTKGMETGVFPPVAER